MGIEDSIKIEELQSEPTKVLLAKIYIQTLKTNGTVKDHDIRLKCLEEDNKQTIKTKVFAILTAAIAVIIIIFNVINMVVK